jgi:hypothetical protein
MGRVSQKLVAWSNPKRDFSQHSHTPFTQLEKMAKSKSARLLTATLTTLVSVLSPFRIQPGQFTQNIFRKLYRHSRV